MSLFIVASKTVVNGSDEKNVVVLGTYKSLEDAKVGLEGQAGMLLNNNYSSLAIYKLSEEENLVHDFDKNALKHVYQRMAKSLNDQADQLKRQAEQALSAFDD